MVPLASLQVAGFEFTGFKTGVRSRGNRGGSCQGLLGNELFRGYLLNLDYPAAAWRAFPEISNPMVNGQSCPCVRGRTPLTVTPSIQDLYLSASLQ